MTRSALRSREERFADGTMRKKKFALVDLNFATLGGPSAAILTTTNWNARVPSFPESVNLANPIVQLYMRSKMTRKRKTYVDAPILNLVVRTGNPKRSVDGTMRKKKFVLVHLNFAILREGCAAILTTTNWNVRVLSFPGCVNLANPIAQSCM